MEDSLESLQLVEDKKHTFNRAPGRYSGSMKQVGQEKLKHGYGRFISDNGVFFYEAQFKNGNVHGYHREYYSFGEYWIGNKKEGSTV